MAQRANLRVVLHDGDRYAVLMYTRIAGHDIYSGPRLNVGEELFRHSYHASGQKHLRILDERSIQEPGTPPHELIGKVRIHAASSGLDWLDWGYKPKADTSKRVTKMIDLRDIAVYPSFTTELWAFEPGRVDLIDEHLRGYEERGLVVLAHVLADWTRPNLLGLVFTMGLSAWENLERDMQKSDQGDQG